MDYQQSTDIVRDLCAGLQRQPDSCLQVPGSITKAPDRRFYQVHFDAQRMISVNLSNKSIKVT